MDPATLLTVNRLATSVRALGPGRRVALWVQGCTLGCAGCASTDTWNADASPASEIEGLAHQLEAHLAGHTGLTITGGEPFQQGPALAQLLQRLNRRGLLAERDVLIFTGYSPARARHLCPQLWDLADALVAGPYLPHRPGTQWLRASQNQQLLLNTDLACRRYARREEANVENGELAPPTALMQVASSGDDLTMAGLPAAGDLDRFRALMEERGIQLDGGVTWRS